MPQFEVKTTEARSVWKSPDGQREIFDVTLDYDGQAVSASTYSKDIATVGWSGTVETYEKEGKGGRPSQTFVKQPPKENPGYGNSSSTSSTSSRSGGYVPKDEKAIQAMWSIGQSVNAHVGSEGLDAAELTSVRDYAIELFHMVDAVKADTSAEPEAASKEDVVVEDIPEQMDMTEIDKIFKKSEDDKPATEEKPWPPKS